MLIPMKWKYRCPKTRGNNKSTHNQQGNKRRNKTGRTQTTPRQRVLILGVNGKLRWDWREREEEE